MTDIFNYKLNPPELEQQYREDAFPRGKTHAVFVALLVIIISLVFTVLDLLTLDESQNLALSTICRIAIIGISAFGILCVLRLKSVRLFDVLIFVWGLLFLSHLVVITIGRSLEFITLILWDIFSIFALFTAVPLPLFPQLVLGFLFSTTSISLWLIFKKPGWLLFQSISIVGAYVFANVFGFIVSRRLKISRRNKFKLLVAERKMRENLEAAMSEIKTLRGILPICSYCKKVRDDRGYWDQLEKYVVEHSETKLSHGMCPDCLKKYYPNVYEKYKGQYEPGENHGTG